MNRKVMTALLAAFLIYGAGLTAAFAQAGAVGQDAKADGAYERNRPNLTPEQRAQLKSIHQSTRTQLEALRNDQSLTPEQRQARARSIGEATRQQVLGILTPEQQEMMKNRRGEGFGRGPGKSRGEGAGMGLSADQKAQLKITHESTRTQVNSVRNDSSLTPEQKAQQLKSIRENSRQQLSGILSAQQLDQLRSHRRHQRRGGRREGMIGPRSEKP